MPSAARAVAVALIVFGGAGCALRYDAAGVTRTGVGLWGFGDPPGVDWNLDWPRREIPDLPASRHPELPPRAVDPAEHPADNRTFAPRACVSIRHESFFGDNQDRASCSPPEPAAALAARHFDRLRVPARG
jgi:hypothetical protein